LIHVLLNRYIRVYNYMKDGMRFIPDYKNIFTGLLVLSIIGCNTKKQPDEELDTQLKEAARIMQQSAETMSSEVVAAENFKKKLSDFFPSDLSGLKRLNLLADYNSDLGISACRAFADYISDDEKQSIRLSISDLGENTDPRSLPALAWFTTDINRDSVDRIERTAVYSGIKIFEQYYPDDGIGELQIILADRYIIDLDGFGVSYDMLREALQKLNLNQIKSMR